MQDNTLTNKLNKRERYKARLRPYDYFEQFEALDFENLGEGDRFYLQDFGVFTTSFLEDEFNIRVRVPAGRLSSEQFLHIGKIIKEYDLTLILTVRAGLQIHGVEADNILTIWKQLNSLGLSTWQSFGDNIRNIVTDVYDGIGRYNKIEVYPLIMQMQDHILKNPRYVGMLPRRISIGISGNYANVSSFFANDIYFALAKKGDTFGFNVYMGGKNTELAKDADIFLEKHEVFDFFKAFVEAFYLHGSRFTRSKTRLFHMIESIGMPALKAFIQKEYAKEFEGSGELFLQREEFKESEILQDNSYGFRYQSDFGRLSTQEIEMLCHYVGKNNATIRIGIDQNLYLCGLKDNTVAFQSQKQSATIVTCAGNLCPYSFWSIKDETSYLPLEKIYKHAIEVGFSGCAKGCGRHRHTDIGLIGLKTNNFGDTEGGARVFLGAQHSNGSSIGRMVFSMVPFVHLHHTITLIIEIFEQSGYKIFEDYSTNVLNKYTEGFLGLWFLANLTTKQKLVFEEQDSQNDFEYEKALLYKYFPDEDFLKLIDENFYNAISILSKQLWTVEGKNPNYKPPIKREKFR